jgi:hypothetical protein
MFLLSALVQSLAAWYFGERRDRARRMAKKATCFDQLFKGRHFEREITILCVRWYLRFKLSFRDLVEMTAEQ